MYILRLYGTDAIKIARACHTLPELFDGVNWRFAESLSSAVIHLPVPENVRLVGPLNVILGNISKSWVPQMAASDRESVVRDMLAEYPCVQVILDAIA